MSEKINILPVKQFNSEIISAFFIITLVAFLISANFYAGFFLPLFVLVMAASFAVSLFFPRAGIYAVVFLTFIFERFFTLQPVIFGRNEYKLYPLDVILAAVVAGAIIQLALKKTTFRFEKPDYFLGAFSALSAAIFFTGVFAFQSSFELSFSSFKHYAFYPLLYFVFVVLFQKKEDLAALFRFAFAGALGILFFLGYGILNGEGLWTEFTPLSTEGSRLLAFTHAFYVSLVFLGFIAYLILEKTKTHFWHFALLALWAVGIIGSMMRHLWIGLFAALIVFCALLPRTSKKRLIFLFKRYAFFFAALAVIVFYFLALFPNSDFADFYSSIQNVVFQRAGSFSGMENDESFSWRGAVWKEGIREWLRSPLFGIGLGKSVYIEIGKYKDFVEVRNFHNSLLVILIQMGLVAFGLFAAFVWTILKKARSVQNKNWMDYALFSAAVFYLAVFLFQPYLETNLLAIFFWMILGALRAQRPKSQSQP